MPKEKPAIPKTHRTNLERSLNELITALNEHAKYLDGHINAMENLTRAIKQLDATVKKEVSLGSSRPSIELKEAITSFLEYNVNPKYYQETGYLKLPVASKANHPDIGKKPKYPKQPSDNNR